MIVKKVSMMGSVKHIGCPLKIMGNVNMGIFSDG